MTPRMASLINDAKQAGYDVTTDSQKITYITKHFGRWQKVVGVVVYEDGTAFDLTVPMSSARGIRKYNDMRHVLRIKLEGPSR